MKTINLLIFATIIFTAACENNDDPTPQKPTLEEEITDLIQPLIDDEVSVGGAVGIFKNGEKQMFFFGKKEKGGENTDENTLYEIGSINKTMTSTILAQMVLDDKIALDDPVQNSLPSNVYPPKFSGEEITFKQLANHTSSLPDFTVEMLGNNFDENDPLANYSEQMMFDFLNGYSLTLPIGTVYEYSNLAFGLLGYTLGQVDQKSISTIFSDYIFDELGMTSTLTEVPVGNSDLAQPYDGDLNPVKPWSLTEATFGAGGALSTIPDLLKYLEANLGLLNTNMDAAFDLAHQNTQTLHAPRGIGLAWINDPRQTEGETLTWHDGGTYGSVAFIGFIKELDMGVVLFFNTQIDERAGKELYILELGNRIIDLMKKS